MRQVVSLPGVGFTQRGFVVAERGEIRTSVAWLVAEASLPAPGRAHAGATMCLGVRLAVPGALSRRAGVVRPCRTASLRTSRLARCGRDVGGLRGGVAHCARPGVRKFARPPRSRGGSSRFRPYVGRVLEDPSRATRNAGPGRNADNRAPLTPSKMKFQQRRHPHARGATAHRLRTSQRRSPQVSMATRRTNRVSRGRTSGRCWRSG